MYIYRERVTYLGDQEPGKLVSLADGLQWLSTEMKPPSMAAEVSGEPWKPTDEVLEDSPANIYNA